MDTDKRLQEIHRLLSTPEFNLGEFTLEPLQHDASSRRYYRLRRRRENALSLLVMDCGVSLPEDPVKDPFISVQKLFHEYGVQVPEIYRYIPRHGLIILEDCGRLTMEDYLKQSKDPDWHLLYRAAVDEMIKIHYLAGLSAKRDCIGFSLAFDEEKLGWELDFFLKHTVSGYLEREIAADDIPRISKFFALLNKRLAAEPRVLNHRDFHSRNLMWNGEQIKVLDFQDARMGPCQYDLVSLLKDSYVNPPSTLEAEMIDYYLTRKTEITGKTADMGSFMEVYHLMTVQRSLKAAGTFGYQFRTFAADRYLENLPAVLSYARAAAEKAPGMRQFLPLFDKYFGAD